MAFSPDGKQIASGGSEGAVNVWSLSRSDQVAATTLRDVVSAVGMSPSGDRVATADNRGDLRIWSSDGRVEYESNAPARGGLVFSENGHFLAGTASDSLFVMDVAKDHALKTLATFQDARDYASSTRYLTGIARDMKHIRIWETAGGGELPPVEVVDPQAIKFDPTGSFLAIKQLDNYGKHGAIRVRDVVANQERQLSIEGGPPREFALGPRGRIVALSFSNPNGTNARRNDYVEVRDVNTGQPLAHLVQDGFVDFMQFDPSGTRLVILTVGNAMPRQQIDIWDWGAGQMRARLFHEDEVSKVRFSDHSSVLATLSAGRVYVWDYFTGALQSQLADAGYVQDVRFSADGRYILTGGNDGTAAIWLWRIEDLQAEACKRLTRNLSPTEWQQYLGTLPYHATCLLPKAAG